MAKKQRVGEDWSEREVELVVADYLDMLRLELLGKGYVKTEHRRKLIPQLDGRSDGSVEFKHQNISAVLVQMGYPYISGYKPRGNFQSLLARSVEDHLSENVRLLDELARSEVLDPSTLPTKDIAISDIFVEPPERITPSMDDSEPWKSRRGRRVDFIRRDAENRRLGKLGEKFVVETERRRLQEAGRDDLGKRVEWVSQTQGDGLGYDVLSFDETSESEQLVEVKTTGLGKFFPFYVSKNEVRCSEARSEQYRLYRVFEFSKRPSIYVLSGALTDTCRLDPIQFRAVI